MLAALVQIAIPLGVFCNVFALALEASPADVIFLLRRPWLLLRSMLAMYVVMVGFAVAVAAHFDFGRTINTVLIVLSLAPVPPALPINNRKTGGSHSYAIGLLVTAVLVALVTVPAWVRLIGYYFHIDAHITTGKIAPVVTITVLAPIFCGILINRLTPKFAARLVRPFARGASLLLVAALLPVLVIMAGPMRAMMSWPLLFAFAGFTITGLVVGHLLGGPNPRERMVLALATAARHPGVAITITAAIFPALRMQAMIVVIWYLLIVLLFAVPYVIWCRKMGQG